MKDKSYIPYHPKYLLVPVIMAASVVAVQIYMGTTESFSGGVVSFVIAFTAGSATLYILYLLYRWWKKRILAIINYL